LTDHDVSTAHERGGSHLKNGELLAAAEGNFDFFITTDQNLRYQQNLKRRRLAILVLPTTSWPKLQRLTEVILSELNTCQPGDDREIPMSAGWK
jgi:hypothetical protein